MHEMSSSERLARLGLSHLANDPEALSAALEQQAAEHRAKADRYHQQRQRERTPWAKSCFDAWRSSEYALLDASATFALAKSAVSDCDAVRERWERLLSRNNGLSLLTDDARRYAVPQLRTCDECAGRAKRDSEYGPMPCGCWSGRLPTFSWDDATAAPTTVALVDEIATAPHGTLTAESLVREHFALLGSTQTSPQRSLWRESGPPSQRDGFAYVRDSALGRRLVEDWELVAEHRLAADVASDRSVSERWRERALTAFVLEGAFDAAIAQGRTVSDAPLGANPFSPLRALFVSGYALDGVVDGAPLLLRYGHR